MHVGVIRVHVVSAGHMGKPDIIGDSLHTGAGIVLNQIQYSLLFVYYSRYCVSTMKDPLSDDFWCKRAKAWLGGLPPEVTLGVQPLCGSSIAIRASYARCISCSKIAASTSNTLGRSVSAETVRRVLRKAGYNGRVARKKPLIGKKNRVKRLKFAKEHILKPQQFWNEVIFSDESKFNIFGSDGRRMVWRKPNTSHHPN
ncbi:transposable element Tcb1 transposase [Trichonephila clavipes]|nr:transposable element Tcb1 transposase [Trichonephila clavipes]